MSEEVKQLYVTAPNSIVPTQSPNLYFTLHQLASFFLVLHFSSSLAKLRHLQWENTWIKCYNMVYGATLISPKKTSSEVRKASPSHRLLLSFSFKLAPDNISIISL